MKKSNGKTELPVNGPLITRAITAHGLSVRDVARRCNVTFNIVNRITRANQYSADLPIRHLLDVCTLLDVSLIDVLTPPTSAVTPTLTSSNEPDDDTTRLATYLLLNPSGSEPEAIAHTFNWNLPRLHAARRALTTHLKPIGMRARHANDRFYLTVSDDAGSRRQADDEAAAIAAHISGERSMTVTMAKLLHQALTNNHPNVTRHADKPILAQAVNLGLLAPADAGDYTPTPCLLDAFPN